MVLQETKIKLSKAVFLRDALTGEPVTTGIRIHSRCGGTIEKKRGGYVLFLGMEGAEVAFEVESPIYQPRSIRLQADGGAELEDVLMYPSPAYPRRAGCTALKGKAAPGSMLRFHIEDESCACRLFANYKKGEEQISFYLKRKSPGALWYIKKKQETTGIYFALNHMEEDSEVYRLKEPLPKAYQMKDTFIYPAFETAADETGAFYLLLESLPQERCTLHYAYENAGKTVQKTAEIFQEKENELT